MTTGTISSDSHTIVFSARDSSGTEYFGGQSTVSPGATPQVYALAWTVGGVSLKWTLVDSSVVETCATARAQTVYANLRDANMHLFYVPATGLSTDCANGTLGFEYDFLPPGTYDVLLTAAGTGNAEFDSNTVTPPQVTITAGDFVPPADPSTKNITMTRTQ